MTISGAKVLLESLRREGVKTIFGYPGGVVLKIYDELFDEHEMKHILVRHEQAAVHMADGYARATGEVGVALVTSGPAATNTVTGLATAHLDSIPLVVITGQVPVELIGNDAFQEVDIVGITRSCTKHNFLVKDIRDLPRIIKEAFHIAATGRPGPVLVDLPKSVSIYKLNPEDITYPEKVNMRSYNPVVNNKNPEITTLVDDILKAEKPVFYVGGGAILANAAQEVTEIVELLGVPTTMTLMALGVYPGTGPYSLGMLGMHGSYATNMAVQKSDLLVALGPRFDDRVTGKIENFAPHAKIAHVDIDPTSISKTVKVDLAVVGDMKLVAKQMLELLRSREADIKKFKERIAPWWREIHAWQKDKPLTYEPSDTIIKPQAVIEEIWHLTKGDAIITADVGQHQMWCAQFYPFTKPRTWINSGGLGTMGYGFPSAMGAKVAFPDKKVISVNGDGGMLMNIQEISTCVEYNIAVVVLIINNFYLGMVRQWQELFFNNRYSFSQMNAMPDYVKLADSFGATGMTIKDPKDLRPALEAAIALNKPVFVDIHVAREENVYPIVPAGAALDEMLLA